MKNQTSINHQTTPFGKQMLADAVSRPILFSTPMVEAILSGRKVVTRRTKGLEEVNNNPDDFQFEWADFALKYPFRFTQKSSVNEKSLAEKNFYQAEAKCPYGKVGDILWVKETSCFVLLDHAPDLLEGARERTQLVYKASVHSDWMEYAKEKYGYKWKPSLFMAKTDCRLFLEITNVKCERLHSMTYADCIAEGIKEGIGHNADLAFKSLWVKLNGQKDWNKNPFVWAISFKVVECPYGCR